MLHEFDIAFRSIWLFGRYDFSVDMASRKLTVPIYSNYFSCSMHMYLCVCAYRYALPLKNFSMFYVLANDLFFTNFSNSRSIVFSSITKNTYNIKYLRNLRSYLIFLIIIIFVWRNLIISLNLKIELFNSLEILKLEK